MREGSRECGLGVVVVWDHWDAADHLGKKVWMAEADDLFVYQSAYRGRGLLGGFPP